MFVKRSLKKNHKFGSHLYKNWSTHQERCGYRKVSQINSVSKIIGCHANRRAKYYKREHIDRFLNEAPAAKYLMVRVTPFLAYLAAYVPKSCVN